MEAQPIKAEPPKRKRRWYQFSLRELMIGVTLVALACWAILDRQQLIHERDEARQRAIFVEGQLTNVKDAIRNQHMDATARLQFVEWLLGNPGRSQTDYKR
jgi:hypothetical protein